MTRLDTYLQQLDNGNFDFQNEQQINRELNEIAEQLSETDAPFAVLNAIAFSIRKSFKYTNNPEEGQVKGLSYTLKGQRTLGDGTIEPFFWPDVTKLTDENFNYFEERYKSAVNLYVKTEYGLLVYFGSKTDYSKRTDFKELLFKDLFQLSKEYYAKRSIDFRYAQHSNILLEFAWGVAKNSKLKDEIAELSKYIFDIIEQSNITDKSDLWILVSYSNLLTENYAYAHTNADFKSIIKKNLQAAKEKEKDDLHGTLYIVDLCVRIAERRGEDKTAYLKYKAKVYELLAKNAESNGNMAVIHFAEEALLLYKRLKLDNDIKRLELYYDKVRGQIEMSEFNYEMPDNYIEKLQEQIESTINESNDEEILTHFIITPWYKTIEYINEQAAKNKNYSVLQSILPTKVMDKFGNTVAEYVTDNERDEFRFWETYALHFQLGSQTMHMFFIEAYEKGKLSYNSLISYLEATWFNEPIERSYFGNKVEVKPIDILKPGLRRIFTELKQFDTVSNSSYDSVTIIDSLTLKVESLLRYFCERIGIPTFKPRGRGSKTVIMEKMLDDLLSDIAHKPNWKPDQITGFDEEDRVMLKYVLTEKAGLNLRNKVAHGLMDDLEYNFQLVVILFSLILKLSKYNFTENKGGEEDESNSK